MNHRLLRCAVACAAAINGLPASAQTESGNACRAPAYDGPPLMHRQDRIARYEGLGEQCLKRLVVECNAAASRQLLDAGSAFGCSLGYEALLRKGFGGDFQALLTWWRTRPDAAPPD